MTEFGADYAGVYDALYREKDYSGEADLIERLFAPHAAKRPQRILDLGCGTGNHAFELSRRGYAVTGVDRSPAMLDLAQKKAADFGDTKPEFVQGDISEIALGKHFDAALMMFTVLGYLREDEDVLAALSSVRRHLEDGALFIFDVWNGSAVLAQRPGERIATANEAGSRIVRKTHAQLDQDRNLIHVHFDLERNTGARTEHWEETHTVRYFFPGELRALLARTGFSLLDLKRFPDGEAPPDEAAWNIIGVARAE